VNLSLNALQQPVFRDRPAFGWIEILKDRAITKLRSENSRFQQCASDFGGQQRADADRGAGNSIFI
jgi:hypothetical protein